MTTRITRRGFAGSLAALPLLAAKKTPTILLRSGWQTVNIGDVAHTPGVMSILRNTLPDSNIILWSTGTDRGVEEMLLRNFPRTTIVKSGEEAFERSDFFLHGSGPSVTGQKQLAEWAAKTSKPYGVFGVTITVQSEAASGRMSDELKALLDKALFVYTRETKSLVNVKNAGIKARRVDFVPDGAFSFDLRDDAKADAFLRQHSLESGKFLCVIPRLRVTPYHRIRPGNAGYSQAEMDRRDTLNAKHAEPDAAKMREAIVAYVRKTGNKALLVPEMTYQLEMFGPLLYDPLPEDVKPKVVRRTEFWLPDEAASTYRHATAVLSSECHSPILAANQGTPCMYVHQPEDGIKGQMWHDVGLGSWYFEVEQATGGQIAETVLDIAARPAAAKKRVRDAVDRVHELQAKGMKALAEAV